MSTADWIVCVCGKKRWLPGKVRVDRDGPICHFCEVRAEKIIDRVRIELTDMELSRLHASGGNKTNGAVGRLIQSKLPSNAVFKRIDSSYHSQLFQIWKLEVEVEVQAEVVTPSESEPTRRIVFDTLEKS